MVDDLKKVKRDRKRISLTQKHELRYIKKSALGLLAEGKVYLTQDRSKGNKLHAQRFMRICKFAVKAVDKLLEDKK